MKLKSILRNYKIEHAALTRENDIVQKFQDCIDYISAHPLENTGETVGKGPEQQTILEMRKFKKAAFNQVEDLRVKIEELEKKVEQPYIKNKK